MYNAALFKAYIGPRVVYPGSNEGYGEWDWHSAIGNDYGPLPYNKQYNIAGSLAAGSPGPLPPIFATPTLPPAAGFWLGPSPGSTGETWEYIAYKNNRADLRRDNIAPNNAFHGLGAPLYIWFPLDSNDGQFELVQESTDNLSARTWTAKLSGVSAPQMILKPEHLIAITFTTEWFPGSPLPPDPEDFDLLCLGIIEKVSMKQDGQGAGKWTIDITSTARLLQSATVPPLRMGPLNVALQAQAEAASSLGAAWKLTLPQRLDGTLPEIDIVEPQEDFTPANVVDENPNTLWVSDGWRGPSMRNDHNHKAWSSVFVNPPETDIFGSKYIEIINLVNLDISWYWVFQKYSYIDGGGATQTRARWFRACRTNYFEDNGLETWTLANEDGSTSERRLIIAENAAAFQRLFPSAEPEVLLDASDVDHWEDYELVRRQWWEGGALFMAWSSPPNSAGHLFAWGDVTWEELNDYWEGENESGRNPTESKWGTDDFDLPGTDELIALVPNTSTPGTVIRRNFNNPGDEFIVDFIHHPGYEVDNQDDHEFIKITLPGMTHVLRESISNLSTEIFLVDGQGNPNVEGLSRHGMGGVVMIDGEIITFAGKDYYQGKLTGCTIGFTHKEGTKVYARWRCDHLGKENPVIDGVWKRPFQDKLFDHATDSYPLEKIEWGRGFYGNGVARYPYIGNYFLRFSPLADARGSREDSHEEDYLNTPTPDTVSSPALSAPNASLNLTVPPFDFGESFRPRTILFQIREVHNKDGVNVVDRPRMNYFRAFVDRRYFNPDTWLDTTAGNGWANELLVDTILGLSGWWPSLFTTLGDETVPQQARQEGVTESDTAWRVGVDAAEYGSSIIWVRRNSHVYSTINTFLLRDTHSPDRIYGTDGFVEMEIVNVRPAEVGQVRLTWKSGNGKLSGVVLWPDQLPRGTTLVEIGPVIANNSSTATIMASNHYKSRRFPYNCFGHLARSSMGIEVGDIHQVDYDFHLTGEITRKLLLVESVTQTIENGRWHTVLGYREIDRQSV